PEQHRPICGSRCRIRVPFMDSRFQPGNEGARNSDAPPAPRLFQGVPSGADAIFRFRGSDRISWTTLNYLDKRQKAFQIVKKRAIIFRVILNRRAFLMANQTAADSAPTIESFTVKRRYLTEREVGQLMDAARKVSRHGHRDATMILVAYRHGLRASEVCGLEVASDRVSAQATA